MEDNSLITMLLFTLACVATLSFGIAAAVHRNRARGYRSWLPVLFFLAMALATFTGSQIFILGIPVAVNASPYGNHYLQYYKFPVLAASPGSGSDFSGKVKLKNHFGHTLATADFFMYHEVSDPQWSESGVTAGESVNWQF